GLNPARLAAFRVKFDAPHAGRRKHEVRHSDSPIAGKDLNGTSIHQHMQLKLPGVKQERRGGTGRKILAEAGAAGLRAVDKQLLFLAIKSDERVGSLGGEQLPTN